MAHDTMFLGAKGREIYYLEFYKEENIMSKQQPGKKPIIRKLGTIATNDIVETTPVVFKDRLYRLEVIREAREWNKEERKGWEEPCLRFVDVKSQEILPTFAINHTFGFAFAEGDIMYAVAGANPNWGSDTLHFYRSKDLRNWELFSEYHLPGFRIYNMNIAKMDDEYTLLIETNLPSEECGPYPFTHRFAKSKDLINWELTPTECAFQKDKYTGSPALYTIPGDKHYYVGYCEALPNARYSNCIARSVDLINWEYSPYNPVLMYDDVEDKKIASPFLTEKERERIEKALDINNSDMEFCEFLGRTIIYYSWGDQMGTEFLAEACYEGPLAEFLQGLFD